MKKVFSFLISAALVTIFFIPKTVTLSSQELLLMYSLLPMLAILFGYNQTRFTYRKGAFVSPKLEPATPLRTGIG